MPSSGGSGGAGAMRTSTFDFNPPSAFDPPPLPTDLSPELELDEASAFENVFRLEENEHIFEALAWDSAESLDANGKKEGKDDPFHSAGESWVPTPTSAGNHLEQAGRPVYMTATMGGGSLTPAQQEKLRNIAMPSHLQLQTNMPVKRSISDSPTSYKDHAASSPDSNGGQGGSRKRKSSAEADEEDEDGSQPPGKKTAHNMIEKRYRTNLNDKIAMLRDAVPSLRIMQKSARGEDTAGDREELGGLAPAHKLNKATVLSKATEYIRHLEKQNEHLRDEMIIQRKRIVAFEKLFVSGSLGTQQQVQISPYQFPPDPSPDGQSANHDPRGMIHVPDDIRRLHNQMSQQTYPVPHEHQPYRRPSAGWQNGGFLGKMMVGSLAGIMIMEGFHETERDTNTPGARGLFALPTEILRQISRSLHTSLSFNLTGRQHVPADQTLRVFKFLILFGIVFNVFIPSFFASRPQQKDIRNRAASLSAAPSLASPIQARRQAWLTAIQTVWVPRHNFFLEAAALLLKMGKLSLRNTIGSNYYALLTGTTEDQEAARVKAWTIALDALLAGGDVEVSKSRLMLTLLASATLPQTPTHLMLQALHIRVLLWEIGNAGFNGFYMFHEFAARLARWRWNEARQLHQVMVSTKDPLAEEMPEHLVALIEQDCDEVLNDSTSQRAYNLAWNLPTTHNTQGVSNSMDNVVEDFAIRSPLDAVAAWYSTLILQRILTEALSSGPSDTIHSDLQKSINLALQTAPIGSTSQTRALVTLAVLVPSQRGKNIASALQAVSPLHDRNHMIPLLINTYTSIQNLPDINLSLRCAMAIAHLERFPAPSNPIAAQKLISSIVPLKSLSLLSFVAAMKLMQSLVRHDIARTECARELEILATELRVWIGGREGSRCGLERGVREICVERCLGIAKKVVGMGMGMGLKMEKDGSGSDAGYVRMEEGEMVGERC